MAHQKRPRGPGAYYAADGEPEWQQFVLRTHFPQEVWGVSPEAREAYELIVASDPGREALEQAVEAWACRSIPTW